MPYVIRNTVVLAVLLLIILFVSIISNTSSARKFEDIKKSYNEKVEMLERLKRTNPDIKDEARIIKELENMQKKALESKKVILKEDNPTLSYQYLIGICDNFCPDVNFNFQTAGSGQMEGISFNTYNISGDANIESLHFFIYQIEYQPPLYIIESIKLSEQSVAMADTVDFMLVLRAYFNDNGTELKDIPMRSSRFTNLTYNPFYSRIHEPILNMEEEKYLNVYTASMIGLTPNKIFLRDENGKINILYPGDKVAYGYLNYINWYKQYAVFKINRIGITENEIIKMNE
jgi:Na+-transporting methylmalonyl-CoA/oxaloacetate decarboxylase gamma subunit